jgi:hypothetical protein
MMLLHNLAVSLPLILKRFLPSLQMGEISLDGISYVATSFEKMEMTGEIK